jgi:ABC-2 type transport system permease protein
VADLRRLPRPVRQYLILYRAAARAALQYRFDFLSSLIGGIAFQGVQLLFLGVLLAKFELIAGWSFDEVGLLFAIRLAAHVVYIVPFHAVFYIDQVVNDGEYDRYLLRPVNPFVQLITRRFPAMAMGDVVLGVVALVVFASRAPIDWTPASVGFLVVAVIGGGLVEGGIQIALSGLTFVATTSMSARNFADTMITTFGGYPLIMFGRLPFSLLTFVFPMAFIAYLPSAVLLGRTGETGLPVLLGWLSPIIGGLIFLGGYLIHRRLSRHYASPGG